MIVAPTFHFFTLVTKTDQYDAMRESLARVGFDEANSVFTVLDNRESNEHEPYSAINEAVRTAQAPHVVFCHQDLLFHQGPEALLDAIRQVQERDPQWAVLGNAGCTPELDPVFCIDDHAGSQSLGDRPSLVLTLDENFLVIRRDAGVGCSPELAGFHLYATDLCLNAYLKGRSAWVIEYRLTHLGTAQDYAGLLEQSVSFESFWRRKVQGLAIATTCMTLVFPPYLPWVASKDRIQLLSKRRTLRAMNYLMRRKRPSWLPQAQFATDGSMGPRLTKIVLLIDRLLPSRAE